MSPKLERGTERTVDITDPKIAKAYAHPLRIEIMHLLDNRIASPSQLSTELAAPLSLTSYHVRQLASMGLVKLVARRQKRGSIEHFYTATVRPRIYDDVWARVPPIVKRAILGGRLTQVGKEVVQAAEAGGFDRQDVHLTRTRLTLTPEDWQTVAEDLAALLTRLDKLKAKSDATLTADPHADRIDATVVMMLFEAAVPGAFQPTDGGSPAFDDEFEDIAPPV